MFEIGWGEILLVGVVALIVIGPAELPAVLRGLGQSLRKVRRMAAEFQGQFHEALREAELADVKKSIDELRESAALLQGSLNPVRLIEDAVTSAPPPAPAAAAESLPVVPVVSPVVSPAEPPTVTGTAHDRP